MIIRHKGLVMAMLSLGAILFSIRESSASQFSGSSSSSVSVLGNFRIVEGAEHRHQKWLISFAAISKDKQRYTFSYLCFYELPSPGSGIDLSSSGYLDISKDLSREVTKRFVTKNDRKVPIVYEVSAHKGEKNVFHESLKIGGEKIDFKKGRVLLVKVPANAQDKPKVKQLDIELPDDFILKRDNSSHSLPSFSAIVEKLKKKSKEVREFLNGEKDKEREEVQ